jgi:hypothetical protein
MKNFFILTRKESECLMCHTTKKPHKAKGYCENCYRTFLKLERKRAVDNSKKPNKKATC